MLFLFFFGKIKALFNNIILELPDFFVFLIFNPLPFYSCSLFLFFLLFSIICNSIG